MINQTDQMVYRLGNLDALQQKISYQMATGKKLEKGSDDSLLYAREVLVDDKIRTFEGLKTQLERVKGQNNMADSSMAEVKKLIEFTKAELIKANTATTSADGMKAIAANLEGLKQNIFDLANTQSEGEYLFSGSDSSVKPFEKDADGKISYVGNNTLRKVAVEEGSYRERGITGLDAMMFTASISAPGEVMSFKANDGIIDQDGNTWRLNTPTNDTLVKYDSYGKATSTTITPVILNATTNSYEATIPATWLDSKFEVKTNIFNIIDDVVNSLKQIDSSGNPITLEQAREGISKGMNDIDKAFSAITVSHAELGGRNKTFEVSLERLSSKLTHYNILSQELGAADLSKVAMEAKSLELTYTALYSTISKMNQLSLVNFMN
ncbi:MAG: flagellar hook-associated protein FlgL [Aliarcobacter sp.]|jgi:flagellar hook-associated protein 3 FlgL|nr:flagellar hook-associated protein FlgL [Aliarcobacter sp.]MBP6714334.1 flagellar hook-associated protein FlgL [Aliarcobacter sp.]MBP7226289.1 flagellar hook-associated protein FlgL [Aliarcobacter sp.]